MTPSPTAVLVEALEAVGQTREVDARGTICARCNLSIASCDRSGCAGAVARKALATYRATSQPSVLDPGTRTAREVAHEVFGDRCGGRLSDPVNCCTACDRATAMLEADRASRPTGLDPATIEACAGIARDELLLLHDPDKQRLVYNIVARICALAGVPSRGGRTT